MDPLHKGDTYCFSFFFSDNIFVHTLTVSGMVWVHTEFVQTKYKVLFIEDCG